MSDTVASVAADVHRLRRVQTLIGHYVARPLSSLRILDLGCRTGAFAVPLAAAGASVFAVDGNTANVLAVRARTGWAVPPNLRLVQADVREGHHWDGRFNVSLCLGLLYHLDAGSAGQLLRRLARRTTGVCIIDTHVGTGTSEWTVAGRTYTGSDYADQPGHPWGSVTNGVSAWFDRESLLRLVSWAGFGEVTPLDAQPCYPGEPSDRLWLVAR